MINTNLSVWENFNLTFINFGYHLCIHGKCLNLGNYGNYDNIFNINLNEKIRLPIEEIEVFGIVEKVF